MSSLVQLTQKGIDCLEKAILDVLFEAKQNGNNPFVRLRDIRKRLGTHSKWTNDNWLVRSLLYKLEEDKRVWQDGKGGPWQLTDTEYNRRKIEIEDEKPSSDDKHDKGVVKGTKVPSSGGKEPASSPEKLVQGTEVSPSKGC